MNIGGNHLYVGEEVQDEHIDISKVKICLRAFQSSIS